jgi:hypothetical protein
VLAPRLGPERADSLSRDWFDAAVQTADADPRAQILAVFDALWLGHDQTETAPVEDPDELADDLTLILEGVLASAQALGHGGPAARGRALAERILDPVPIKTRMYAPVLDVLRQKDY